MQSDPNDDAEIVVTGEQIGVSIIEPVFSPAPDPQGALLKTPLEPGTALPKALRALRHRNYQLFFAGQLISLIGTWMQSVAQSWLVYTLTGSSILLGSIAFCGQIPVFLIGPIGGLVADRFQRRKTVVITQSTAMVLALLLAALTLSKHIRIWEIFAIAAMLGTVNAFDIPARQAFVVEMVGKEDMTNAIALNSSMVNGARIIGPAVAGLLVSAIGEGWCFLANGVSYIAVIAGLLLMRVTPRLIEPHSGSAFSHVAEGFRFVGRTKPILALLLLIGTVSMIGMPYVVLMPIFAKHILHGDSRALGYLMGSSGCGALLGALTLAARHGDPRGLGRWVGWSAATFGIGLILFAQSRWLLLSMALLLPVGYGMMVQMASTNTLIQSMTPDKLRGRVMSVYSMMFMGMAPFGGLLAGVLSNHIGPQQTVMLGGAISIVGAVVFGTLLAGLRPEAELLISAQESQIRSRG